MDSTPILNVPWPHDLDATTVPFARRTVTVLERQGMLADPVLLDAVTEADVLSWWNAGPVTVNDLRTIGDEAIRRHHSETDLLRELEADLSNMASEPWARHVWRRDPRFARLLPNSGFTVYDLAISGPAVERRVLWEHSRELRGAIDSQAQLSLLDAISQYVEAISGQHGERLQMLLAHTAFNGGDPINGTDAARRLGVSHQRFYQITQQLYRARVRVCPSAGVWTPQIGLADEGGWPEGVSPGSRVAIQMFFLKRTA